MDDPRTIVYPIPPGAAAMSLPVKEGDRLRGEDVRIEDLTEEDLVEFVRKLPYGSVNQLLLAKVEVEEDRPRYSERVKAMAQLFRPWLGMPGCHVIKAVHVPIDDIMGVAVWLVNGPHAVYPTSYPMHAGTAYPAHFIPNPWRADHVPLLSDLMNAAKPGSAPTAADLARITRAHRGEAWDRSFAGNDRTRLAEMGARPHWYLAGLATWEQWRGRGVGTTLINWGLRQADRSGWETLLESSPNARPVYLHLGFEPTESHGEGKGRQMVRQPKTAAQ